MNPIVYPKDLDSLRGVLTVAIEAYQGSPVKNANKLNEAMAEALGFGNYDRLAASLKEHERSAKADIHVPDVRIDDKNIVTIDGSEIHEAIFDEERSDYIVRTREELIDNLTYYITEARDQKGIMLEDLKYLMSIEDEFVFSSISTNEYVAASDNPEQFAEIAQSILDLDADFLREQCEANQ